MIRPQPNHPPRLLCAGWRGPQPIAVHVAWHDGEQRALAGSGAVDPIALEQALIEAHGRAAHSAHGGGSGRTEPNILVTVVRARLHDPELAAVHHCGVGRPAPSASHPRAHHVCASTSGEEAAKQRDAILHRRQGALDRVGRGVVLYERLALRLATT